MATSASRRPCPLPAYVSLAGFRGRAPILPSPSATNFGSGVGGPRGAGDPCARPSPGSWSTTRPSATCSRSGPARARWTYRAPVPASPKPRSVPFAGRSRGPRLQERVPTLAREAWLPPGVGEERGTGAVWGDEARWKVHKALDGRSPGTCVLPAGTRIAPLSFLNLGKASI